MIAFRPTASRKVSVNGALTIYVRGHVYELAQADLDARFPMGGYELVRDTKALAGGSENKSGEAASTAPVVPVPADARTGRRTKWLGRKG